MEVSFGDLESNCDVYYIIILFLFNFRKNEVYSEEDIKDFKNYTLANPRALLDKKIKGIIDKCLVCNNIHNYFGVIEKFMINKTDITRFMYSIRLRLINSIPTNNYVFYSTNFKYLIFIEFFEFTNEIREIIYDNIQKFIIKYNRKDDRFNFNRKRYWDILAEILRIYNEYDFNHFKKLFIILISRLNKDLIKLDIDSIDRNRILNKIIKTFNWTDNTNRIYYSGRSDHTRCTQDMTPEEWSNYLLGTKFTEIEFTRTINADSWYGYDYELE